MEFNKELKLKITEKAEVNLFKNIVLFGAENIGKSYLFKNMIKKIVENVEQRDIFFYTEADLVFSSPLNNFKSSIIEKKTILDLESNINIIEALIEFRKTIVDNKESNGDTNYTEAEMKLLTPTFIVLDDMSTTIEHLKATSKENYFELILRIKSLLEVSNKYNIYIYISEKDYLNEGAKYTNSNIDIYDLEHLKFDYNKFNHLQK